MHSVLIVSLVLFSYQALCQSDFQPVSKTFDARTPGKRLLPMTKQNQIIDSLRQITENMRKAHLSTGKKQAELVSHMRQNSRNLMEKLSRYGSAPSQAFSVGASSGIRPKLTMNRQGWNNALSGKLYNPQPIDVQEHDADQRYGFEYIGKRSGQKVVKSGSNKLPDKITFTIIVDTKELLRLGQNPEASPEIQATKPETNLYSFLTKTVESAKNPVPTGAGDSKIRRRRSPEGFDFMG